MAHTLQVIDGTLLAIGGLFILAWLAWLARAGRWRNPLAGVPIPERGPHPAAALGVFVLLMATQVVFMTVLTIGQPEGVAREPGTDAWHRAQLGDDLAKIVMWVVMGTLLVRTGSFTQPRPRWRMGALALLTLGGTFVTVTVVALQVGMVSTVWNWFAPDLTPPQHPVLEALETAEWGRWGIVQLFLGALVIAPVTEELLFRGVLLQTLCGQLRLGWAAIVVSAVIFGMFHLGQPQAVLPLATMGVILGYLRLRSGSLWPCILVHFLFNARTMTYTWLAPPQPA